jgi:hypothetical protein
MRKVKINDRLIVKKSSIPELMGKEVIVKKVNWIELTVRLPHGRQDYFLLDSDIDFLEPEQLSSLEKRAIIKKMIDEKSLNSKRGEGYFKFINHEVGALNQLIEEYPDLDFWRQYTPDFSVKCISWYLSPEGDDLLRKHYNPFVSKVDFKKKETSIGQQKLGDDVKIQKPKSVIDWLK